MSTLRDQLRALRVLARMLTGPERRWARAWWQSWAQPDWLLHHRQPWLTFGAAEYIREYLATHPRPRVFEFGSGASTLFWIDVDAIVTSVEHDAVWFERVAQLLPADVDYRLVPPDGGGTLGDPSDPSSYRSADAAFLGCSFERYARQVVELPDGALDIVLVDGRARPSCLMHALPKVRPGGLLVLDNAERDYYTRRISGLDAFDQLVFKGHHPTLLDEGRTDIYLRR